MNAGGEKDQLLLPFCTHVVYTGVVRGVGEEEKKGKDRVPEGERGGAVNA